MKIHLLFLYFLGLTSTGLYAQTIWNGATINVEKQANADWTVEENQDRITDKIWITRANRKGIFNIKTETNFVNNTSPEGTEWAMGTTEDLSNLSFSVWKTAVNSNPPNAVGKDMVLHLIEEDIYIDIKFTSWGKGSAGGGSFAYERSTNQNMSTVVNTKMTHRLAVFPNPTTDFLTVLHLQKRSAYAIYSALGTKIKQGFISPKQKINIHSLKKGVYFLQIDTDQTIRFIKK